ncbi:ISL3 family transposase [Methylobacterium sp. NEAU 140]|uniref:ISL3 family transposase n=1 Tax=Methylobacterium sp. NEAU 140 TaxID=3064945 RepID=UPI002732C6FF|nr:ISL3 family transposase [Methylobacterium sp. NEAU 140]MDP4026452.1 ISL3 family transposase [Methylobacterium sp. NEAU 140]
MPKRLLPFIPPSLRVVAVTTEPQHVTVLAVPRSTAPCCPACRIRSDRVHGSYERHLADLPWQGCSVGLRVRLRRLRCRNPACPRRTFSETPPDVAAPHARRSRRPHDLQRHLGLALGGAPAARLAHRLAIPASSSTLLRIVRAGPTPVALPPRVIAIDEWAWRRGRRYGTVIVDLERRAIADLLPDRDAEAVADWLRRHPGVEIVARDRAEVYAEGVRHGAPEAVHVLDRWHLLRNLGEALQEAITGQHAVIRSVARTLGDERAAMLRDEKSQARPVTVADRRKLERHAPRRARHAELLRLHAAGASVAGLARHLDLDRKTVRRWLRRDEPPTWAKPPRPSVIDPYRAYLDRRWSEGCRNGAALARELDQLGARIKPRVVRAWATARRRVGADRLDHGIAGAPPAWKPPGTRRIAQLLQGGTGASDGEDGVFIEHLRRQAPSLADAAELAVRFAAMLRGQSAEAVDDWLRAARSSALKRFASGLRRDAAALANAIALPWSTGPAEGQISRLKTIKRQMYGRAGFELLRQRVLNAA